MRIALLLLITGCTTLGPMPATTGVSAVPIGRPGGEAQLGPVPGFFLSSSAREQAQGAPIMQASAVFEPDRWIGLPGLVLGARLFGQSGDTPGEPYVGYRRQVGDGLAIGGGVYGTTKRSSKQLASYRATRAGGEAALDATLWEPTSWLGVHVQGAAAATYIDATGTYCVDTMGIAKDCNVDDTSLNTMISGEQSGVYPAGTGTIALDIARGTDSVFAGARLAFLGAVGTMPLVRDGEKTGSDVYAAIGFTLTLGLAN